MKSFLSILFSCLILSSYSQIDLNNGLVAHLPFNGNTSDVSGKNNNGEPVNGPQLTTDRFGKPYSAYYFDGNDDYIRISDKDGHFSTTPFSVVLWFYPETDQFKVMLGKREFGTTNGQQFQLSVFRPSPQGLFSSITSDKLPCIGDLTNSVLSMTNYNKDLCLNRWYCVIVTFDGTLHKMYLDGKLVSQNAPNFPKMMQCKSDIRLGNWWSLDPLTFQGKLDDFRWYNRAINEDEIIELSKNSVVSSNYDFTFEQQLCSPLTVKFTTQGSPANAYKWNFGDNTSGGSSNRDPIYTYKNKGVYDVQLIAGLGACTDTVKKTVAITLQEKNIIRQPDTSICSGTTLNIKSDTSSAYCWGPVNLVGSNVFSSITVSPAQTTTYSLMSYEDGLNLVQNGNFSEGNTGFNSDYLYKVTNTASGEYYVGANPNAWNNTFCASCGDHTSGNGNMLLVNGATVPGKKIWNQQISVLPNTTYAFSFWIYCFSNSGLPALSLNVNDKNAGIATFSNADVGQWVKRLFSFYSGTSTTVDLTLINTNTSALNGNDFALDDISFSTRTIVTDSVTITVLTQLGKMDAGKDTTLCSGESVQLAAKGSAAFTWSPAAGLSDASSANPLAAPLQTTTYILSTRETGVCSVNDTITIRVNPKPVLTHSNDTSFCSGTNVPGIQLTAQGGSQFNWSPATGLNDAAIASPFASPAVTTLYTVTTANEFGCSDTGQVRVSVAPFVPVTASGDTVICSGNPLVLQASGASAYFWSPSFGLSDASSANPVFTGNQTTTYIVSAPSAGNCSGRDTVTVTVNLSPQLQLSPTEVLICNGGNAQLTVTGGDTYSWTPTAGLNNPSLSDPIASPQFTTTYVVQTTDANGCSDSASVKVIVGPKGKLFVPNAFTPNGDGLNDCIGIKGAGGSTTFEFAIFNRFGERVFHTSDPGACWNGVFRGVSQPSGTFAWYLKVQSPCGPVTDKGLITLIR